MFERILYPTDFSDVSKKALNFIKQLKDAGAKEVVVLHVIDEREIEHIAQIPEAGLTEEALVTRRNGVESPKIRHVHAAWHYHRWNSDLRGRQHPLVTGVEDTAADGVCEFSCRDV